MKQAKDQLARVQDSIQAGLVRGVTASEQDVQQLRHWERQEEATRNKHKDAVLAMHAHRKQLE